MSTTEDSLRACEHLIEAFAWHVDRHEYDNVIALFTSDAIFYRPDRMVTGHVELRAMLDARPKDIVTRHLCTNIRLDKISSREIQGRCYITLISAPLKDGRADGPKVALTGVYHDRFLRTRDGWRIIERRAVIA